MATSIPVPTSMRATGDSALGWQRFKRQYLNYAIAAKLHDESQKRQVVVFFACIGSEALDIFVSFDLPGEEDSHDISKVMATLESHFVGEITKCTNALYSIRRNENQPNLLSLF